MKRALFIAIILVVAAVFIVLSVGIDLFKELIGWTEKHEKELAQAEAQADD